MFNMLRDCCILTNHASYGQIKNKENKTVHKFLHKSVQQMCWLTFTPEQAFLFTIYADSEKHDVFEWHTVPMFQAYVLSF